MTPGIIGSILALAALVLGVTLLVKNGGPKQSTPSNTP